MYDFVNAILILYYVKINENTKGFKPNMCTGFDKFCVLVFNAKSSNIEVRLS